MDDDTLVLTLLAPVSGSLVPLAEVPDPVFAEKMLGDGIAVLPTGTVLVAPCDGTVIQMHGAGHALTLRSAAGVDIFIHIGLETVLLNGEGFTPKVFAGDRVRTGDALIVFDSALIAARAVSTLTMMIVAGGDSVAGYRPAQGVVTAGETPALELTLRKGARREIARESSPRAGKNDGAVVSCAAQSGSCTVTNAGGLHARPAAMLAARAKHFEAAITLRKDGREANAKSLVSLLGLDVRQHDNVSFHAAGPDAEAAVAAVAAFVRNGFGETAGGGCQALASTPAPGGEGNRPDVFRGIPVSPGLARGVIAHLRREEAPAPEKAGPREEEEAALASALEAAKKDLLELERVLRAKGEAGGASVFAAHREFLDDPELLRDARDGLARKQSAASAWRDAFTARADSLAGMANQLLAGRAADIRDAGGRVLRRLAGRNGSLARLSPDAILVADDLSPSEVTWLERNRVRGFCTTGGSVTSHAAFLAQSAGMAAVAGVDGRVLELPEGTPVILDGSAGELRVNPGEAAVAAADAAIEAAAVREPDVAEAMRPAVTRDGARVMVMANIGNVAEAEDAVRYGCDGVGLLRSEFVFLHRAAAPSEAEQTEAYVSVAKTLGRDRDLVVRALDVGGDKPLSYLPTGSEANPFLGVRGIRFLLRETDFFATQVRAILRAAPFGRLRVMFPMVACVEELRKAKSVVMREMERLGLAAPVSVGIMIEVPSAAILAGNLACEADFFSIGTNDLTQYTLAADRSNPNLADLADGLHPAVLRLIAMSVDGAHAAGKRIGVCGALAADTLAVPVLLGLGVDELSVPVTAVPAVKALVRRQNMGVCGTLAADALTMLTAADVRAYVGTCLHHAAGLGKPSDRAS